MENVSGTLPATLTFDNLTGFNDYFEDFTFGSLLSFQVSLYGPALSTPDGVSTSGSAFAFSMFSDTAGTVPTLTTDTTDGFATLINVNLDGTSTLTNYVPSSPANVTPEPSSLLLLVTGLFGLGMLTRRRPTQGKLHI